MKTRDEQILTKILVEINVINELIAGYTVELFVSDERTKRAVCMTLINIGELAKNITDELRSETPDISWRGISGMRDITAHKYQTLRMEDVWHTVIVELPKLNNQIHSLLNNTVAHGL